MNQPRQHHEVPRFYLERFANRHTGQVEVFDLDDGRGYHQAPSEAATYRDAYAHTRKDGSKDYGVEDLLSRCETLGSRIYDRMVSGAEITEKERADFATFLGSMYVRSPFMRRHFAEFQGHMLQVMAYAYAENDAAWASVEEDMKRKGKHSEEGSRRARELLRDPSRLTIQIAREATLVSIGMLTKAAEAIFDMRWSLARATGATFITSDSPLTLGALRRQRTLGIGLRSPEAMLSFPLTPKVCWLGHWVKAIPPVYRCSVPGVEDFNRMRVRTCERKIFAAPFSHNLEGIARIRPEPTSAFRIGGYGPERRASVNVVRRIKDRNASVRHRPINGDQRKQ